ncbi:tumor necrosis factor receptor superfamily member 17 [Microcaecilia unicolor]|uniref:Tumor necrosis factor receptor superfamily member 17 n=1 Tax=Microcaecilia unicolor TaxID=1415580 RepID=A0A6P7YX09_9AMPH|nr:tumor necrosis factor receptor superfamily member 17 [Microcaecilia unicolor]
MSRQCPVNEYFDMLLQICQSCHVRCPRSPPRLCHNYCNNNVVNPVKVTEKDKDGVLWICLGTVLFLTVTVFILTVLLKKLHPRTSKDEFWQTETGLAPNVCKADTKNTVNNDVDDHLLPATEHIGKTAVMCEADMEENNHEICSSPKLQPSPDTQFPLPATEEGATVLVTTKTSDYCNYRPGVLGDTFVEIWKSFCSTS